MHDDEQPRLPKQAGPSHPELADAIVMVGEEEHPGEPVGTVEV